jgi:uncharacterized pyridoxamine 5'-phosphate oxidase family protein
MGHMVGDVVNFEAVLTPEKKVYILLNKQKFYRHLTKVKNSVMF